MDHKKLDFPNVQIALTWPVAVFASYSTVHRLVDFPLEDLLETLVWQTWHGKQVICMQYISKTLENVQFEMSNLGFGQFVGQLEMRFQWHAMFENNQIVDKDTFRQPRNQEKSSNK